MRQVDDGENDRRMMKKRLKWRSVSSSPEPTASNSWRCLVQPATQAMIRTRIVETGCKMQMIMEEMDIKKGKVKPSCGKSQCFERALGDFSVWE